MGTKSVLGTSHMKPKIYMDDEYDLRLSFPETLFSPVPVITY